MSEPTHFERLGLQLSYAIDPAHLERSYLARSRELHPDYHQVGSTEERKASLMESAALNDAYATLKQPFRRAEYLLALEGGPSAADHKSMEPGFLEEMLDLRMQIEEIRATPAFSEPSRDKMSQELRERASQLEKKVATEFAGLSDLGESARRSGLLRIRESLNAARYIDGLARDLNAD